MTASASMKNLHMVFSNSINLSSMILLSFTKPVWKVTINQKRTEYKPQNILRWNISISQTYTNPWNPRWVAVATAATQSKMNAAHFMMTTMMMISQLSKVLVMFSWQFDALFITSCLRASQPATTTLTSQWELRNVSSDVTARRSAAWWWFESTVCA